MGTKKKKDGDSDDDDNDALNLSDRERLRWLLILKLCAWLVAADTFIRWSHYHPRAENVDPLSTQVLNGIARTFVGCLIETIAFHSGVMFACFVVMTFLDWRQGRMSKTSPVSSGIRLEFRYSLIPLTIFYSSLTKLFLLFLLTIWQPDSTENMEPARIRYAALWENSGPTSKFIAKVLEILDEDNLDREWVVRNVMGGMSAGFGLRVVLDCHPIFTTMTIVSGWAIKTATARLISGWVGGDQKTGEAWLASSIP